MSLKGIFFSSLLQYGDFLCPFVFQAAFAGCVLTHFSPVLPPQPYLLRGVQVHPPLSLYREDAVGGGGGWSLVAS